MNFIANIITEAFDLLLFPFRGLAPIWGITFLSLLSGVLILLVYKAVSNQEAIKTLKKRIWGNFFGIYLFRDEPTQILKTQARLMKSVFRYLGHSLRPLMVLIIPIILICIQMQLRYGHNNLRTGEETIVSVTLAPPDRVLVNPVELRSSPGITIQTPPLRIAELNQVNWRIKITAGGEHTLTFLTAAGDFIRTLDISPRIIRLYPSTKRASFSALLEYPGEDFLPADSALNSISITYPPAKINLLGIKLHWIIWYFILAMVFGFALKKPLGVEF